MRSCDPECDSAILALTIAGLDEGQATRLVSALRPALPEATAEDLTQIVLSSSVLSALQSAHVNIRIPDELKSVLPQLAPLLKNSKLKSWFGRRQL
ncbi:MAG: hypothetical protein C5B58_15400 [Acidobacteria bacterium]|nr:MAG: hypothetical protein C5B58_15400 [Acidobacteriota bacterium]